MVKFLAFALRRVNKIREIGRLEKLARFMASVIGSEISVKRISDMMASDGIKMLPLTVESFIDAFRSGYILYRADRYDVKGKKLLKEALIYSIENKSALHYY